MDLPGGAARALQLSRPGHLERLLAGPVVAAARGLLGARLVRETSEGVRVGRIVEVEAYAGAEDLASHARFGPSSRAGTMYGPPGRAYVYGVYGMHTCLNVVTGPAGAPSAILLRAVEPLAGIDAMRHARLARAVATRRVDRDDPAAAAARLARLLPGSLAAGPANLAASFDVTRADDGINLLDPRATLRLEPRPRGERPPAVAASARVGIAYAGPGWGSLPWRFMAAWPWAEKRSG